MAHESITPLSHLRCRSNDEAGERCDVWRRAKRGDLQQLYTIENIEQFNTKTAIQAKKVTLWTTIIIHMSEDAHSTPATFSLAVLDNFYYHCFGMTEDLQTEFFVFIWLPKTQKRSNLFLQNNEKKWLWDLLIQILSDNGDTWRTWPIFFSHIFLQKIIFLQYFDIYWWCPRKITIGLEIFCKLYGRHFANKYQ